MNEFPLLQAVPLPSEGISFRIRDTEVTRYNSGWDMQRPYLFPVVGPGGQWVTRMGHPHDPTGHRHHYSVWVAHHDINGLDFWSDQPAAGKQVHRNILALEDGAESAAARVAIAWVDLQGKALINEERTYRVVRLPDSEILIDIHLCLMAVGSKVILGPTPFGLMAIRVAKTMSVADGGGQILNSEGALGEQAIFWKPASWCDYSGPVKADLWNGITLFSHPSNINHPPEWHVRSDGWMGACLSREKEKVIPPDEPLLLRYALYVHNGTPNEVDIPGTYMRFAESAYRPCTQ
ncbi:MAG: PmoA family protein [Candidatus Zipacnadales bacterium]